VPPPGPPQLPDAYDRNNVFARILRGEIPSERVYEDEEFVAFRDIAPAAPTHVVLIPRGEPPSSLVGLSEDDAGWAGRLLVTASRVAARLGLEEGGYRVVINSGRDAGQVVPHIHAHILGGGKLGAIAGR
jgi:histidine triad (HIT) family protein